MTGLLLATAILTGSASVVRGEAEFRPTAAEVRVTLLVLGIATAAVALSEAVRRLNAPR